jgi:DNA polymerase III epsilon subunit-like protein
MSRHEEWQKVLDSEITRWSALSCEQLASELQHVQAYEVEIDSKKYQVEVELLENTEDYLHVIVAVDDGSVPASISPLTHSFIRPKHPPNI